MPLIILYYIIFRSGIQDAGEKRCSDGNDKGEGKIDRTEDEQTGFYVEVSREGNEISRDLNGKDGQMEKALEEQAQLIDQFRAEENAQREWEMMYSQNRKAPKVCFFFLLLCLHFYYCLDFIVLFDLSPLDVYITSTFPSYLYSGHENWLVLLMFFFFL
jgi:hypothetical protein